MQSIELLSLESIETKYSKPVLVGEDGVDKKNIVGYNTLAFQDDSPFGYGLIIDKKTPNSNWGLVADVKHNPSLSLKHKAVVLEHAKSFANQNQKINVHPSMEMYYATVSDSKNSDIYIESTDLIKT